MILWKYDYPNKSDLKTVLMEKLYIYILKIKNDFIENY